jgi:parvulin-like peptidyl-prolyl isomerase
MDQTSSRRTRRLLIALLLSGLVTGVARAQAPKPPAASSTPAAGQAAGANQSPGLTFETPEPPDKVVLKVGDKQFTKADIDSLIESLPPQAQRSIATQGRKPLGDQYALYVMLSQQAHLHHLDLTPEFVHKLAIQKLLLEAQAANEEIVQQAKVTPEDIQQYYTAHAPDYDEIMVRQIFIRVKAADPKADPAHPAPPTSPGVAPEEAKTRAEAIRKELLAGTDIKKVMDDFKAPGDVIIDAEPRKVRRGTMRNPEMEKAAFGLKDGEVSEPVPFPQALVFFQVTGHSHLELKDVSADIEKTLKQDKINAAMAELKKSANLWMDEQYFAPPPKEKEGPSLGAPTLKSPPKP